MSAAERALAATTAHWWDHLLVPAAQIIATVLIAMLVRLLVHRAINAVVASSIERAAARDAAASHLATRVLARAAGVDRERHRQRAATTGSLLRNLVSIIVFALVVLTVMGEVGVPLAPLIASAGIGGVALGFGAQSLVRDFLSGIFMIVEDQFGVGDVVDTGTVVGTVEDVSLRITRMRDGNGVVWYVRNGEILRLGNQTQGWSTSNVDVPLALDQDLDGALALIGSVAGELDQDPAWSPRLVRSPDVVGVESMAGGVVTVRVVLGCAPGDGDPVARELRSRLLRTLPEAGVALAASPTG